MGGEVDFVLTAASFAYTFELQGKLGVFAVFDTRRMREMPDVPTITEAGVNVHLRRTLPSYVNAHPFLEWKQDKEPALAKGPSCEWLGACVADWRVCRD